MNYPEGNLTKLCVGAKWAFTTRRVSRDDVGGVEESLIACGGDETTFKGAVNGELRAGDLIIAEVMEIGQHKKLQLASGRASRLYPGDHVVVAVGDRYAPDQFEGLAVIRRHCDLLAGGGVAGEMQLAHEAMSEPTRLSVIGALTARSGARLNVGNYAVQPTNAPDDVAVIGVFGASMNAGKTTAAVSLAHGLKRAGWRVTGVKATGTGAFGDYNAFLDAGVPVLDFTDAGMATTYRMPVERIERGFETLIGTAAARGAEIVVVEFADGVFQAENQDLMANSSVIKRLDAALFAAPDALSAVGGVIVLDGFGIRPFAISGKVTRSPLATAEATKATGVKFLTREELCDPSVMDAELHDAVWRRKRAPKALAA